MSNFRRRLLSQIEGAESDIDYVIRLFSTLFFIYPASIYYDNSRLHMRGWNGGEDWPRRRFLLVLLRSLAKIPVTWWGTNGGYYLYPDEANLSYLHIPPSIKIFKFKHSAPSSYQISMDVFSGLTHPLVYKNSWWRDPESWYTFNFSDNQDKWIAFTGRYKSSNLIIPFTTSDQFKLMFDFKIVVE